VSFSCFVDAPLKVVAQLGHLVSAAVLLHHQILAKPPHIEG
jgi:hypothetical protein